MLEEVENLSDVENQTQIVHKNTSQRIIESMKYIHHEICVQRINLVCRYMQIILILMILFAIIFVIVNPNKK